ncbi:uncharacterized protein LOC117170061 [Belonocnema kinseyi]|uniref:uncharacterized protein LOC117170061 n=1 Tax=Belonocnema kinseyi TaxID=2817044 RepID=UPI00143DD73E|nr:uncharacterized protein LOC117170061 [Belonocnema kinseyi]
MVNFYRIALPHVAEIQAPLNKYLRDSKKNDKREIPWNPETEDAFEQVKNSIANDTLLSHPAHESSGVLITPQSQFAAPDGRFRHVHIDIIGPLPESNGHKYCLTIIHRFSHWPEAVPLLNNEAVSVCRAFVDQWVSRTTAYRPASNGMIESWHRTLKAAIMRHADNEWSRSLSTVMLGLRSNVLDDDAFPAEFTFVTILRIPEEFVLFDDFTLDPHIFLEEFREHIRKLKPIPVAQQYKIKPFLYKELKSCPRVFLRLGARKSLERSYRGPHKIINRTSDRVYEIDVEGTPRQVSVDNIRSAYFTRDIDPTTLLTNNASNTSNVVPPLRTHARKNVTFNIPD